MCVVVFPPVPTNRHCLLIHKVVPEPDKTNPFQMSLEYSATRLTGARFAVAEVAVLTCAVIAAVGVGAPGVRVAVVGHVAFVNICKSKLMFI